VRQRGHQDQGEGNVNQEFSGKADTSSELFQSESPAALRIAP
jgi:hypothetical protein